MQKCRISGTNTADLFSLGSLYVSDFVPQHDTSHRPQSELGLCFSEESKLLQLNHSLPADSLYGKYWYRSGINASMREALRDVVAGVGARKEIKPGDLWLDIACNDGTLLSFVHKDVIRVGIDPVEDSFKRESLQHSDDILQDFFSAAVYQLGKYGSRKADIITIIAMFYDLDDPCSFLDDVNTIMADDGLMVLQLSYTPLMVKQLAFDNICHEHVCYYSLASLQYLLEKKGFRVVDCELNDVNGGSFRVYVQKACFPVQKFKTAPFRDVAGFRVQALLQYEESFGYNTAEKYVEFYTRIQQLKQQTVAFIQQEHARGKRIWGYGASTKGNTLLQWFGLDSTIIEGIAERSPYKYGLQTVGTNIPIYSEEDMRRSKPDYLLILPWHFVEEFKKREHDYLEHGAFIVPCPKFEVIC